MLRFKKDLEIKHFFRLHPKLLMISYDMADVCFQRAKHVLTVSSMLRPKTTDSGVHATGRAIDFSPWMYDPTGVNQITKMSDLLIDELVCYINSMYPRADGKDTMIYHDVGLGAHFHIQVRYDSNWSTFESANIDISNKLK